MQKSVVILGTTSFIGLELMKTLLKRGYKVTAVCRKESVSKIDESHQNLKTLTLDMKEYGRLGEVLEACDCFIPLTWSGTKSSERSNSEIHQKCLEHMKNAVKSVVEAGKCKQIISLGSAAEYGNNTMGKTESDDCTPQTEYGIAKHEFYHYVKDIYEYKHIPYYCFRIFSVYGPTDYTYKMINGVILKMLKNEDIVMSTSCIKTWNFLYIDDLIRVLLLAIECNFECGCYNIGNPENKTLKEYLQTVYKILKPNCKLVFGDNSKDDSNDLHCNINKIKKVSDWSPLVTFEEGITRISKYYKYDLKE